MSAAEDSDSAEHLVTVFAVKLPHGSMVNDSPQSRVPPETGVQSDPRVSADVTRFMGS